MLKLLGVPQLIGAQVELAQGIGVGHHRVDRLVVDVGLDQMSAAVLSHFDQGVLGLGGAGPRGAPLVAGALAGLVEAGDEALMVAQRMLGGAQLEA